MTMPIKSVAFRNRADCDTRICDTTWHCFSLGGAVALVLSRWHLIPPFSHLAPFFASPKYSKNIVFIGEHH
jgi:hypothetical protein